MIQKIFNTILVIVFILLIILFSYKRLITPETIQAPVAVDSNKQDQKHLSKQEVENIVKNFIINNPNMIINSLENMQKKNVQESSKKTSEYIKTNWDKITTSANPPTLGSKEGDISVVIFYDYNCSFCKKANIVTNKILDFDKGIKVILRPLPILGETSAYTAKAALAMQKIIPSKFTEIHNEMMLLKVINEDSIKRLAKNYDLDYSIIENEINSYAIQQIIENNFELARSLGISGAPSHIINGVPVPGYISEDKFKKIILHLRATTSSEENLIEAK